MESDIETTCTCSLITINYKVNKMVPTSPASAHRYKPLYQSHGKKTKISLSKSFEGGTTNSVSFPES